MSVNGQMLALVRNLLPGLKELVEQNMYCNYMITWPPICLDGNIVLEH